MINLIRAEIIKFRSVRSTLILLGSAGALVILIAVLQARDIAKHANSEGTSFVSQHLYDLTAGVTIAVFLFGALGVQVIGQEYRFNTIRTTFAAAPIRWRVLLAKLVVATSASALVSFVMMGICALIGMLMLPDFTLGGVDQRVIWATALFAVGWTAMGVGVGAILRQPIAGILILQGEGLVAEGILVNLFHGTAKWVPFQNGIQMTTWNSGSGNDIQFRSVLGGGVYFFIVVAVVLAIGLYLANKRDA